MNRPFTTLFMLMSIDGKISSGKTDNLDCDKDWKNIDGVKEGLHQYYEIEQTTDLWSFITGRVLEKVAINEEKERLEKSDISFVIVDNKQHLNENGLSYLSAWLKRVVIVTTNKDYNAFGYENIDVIYYDAEIDFRNLFAMLKTEYKVEKLTVQSGGSMNAKLMRLGLIDNIRIIVAPLAVGGADTPTIIDGVSAEKEEDLKMLKALRLMRCKTLEDSYLDLTYEVLN